jgi:phage anti-repressor protein
MSSPPARARPAIESRSPNPASGNRDVGGDLVQTVDARRLHSFLEIGKDFSNWIADRIGQYQLIENVDFIIYRENSLRTDYHLTLDAGKELAMVERNSKGRFAPLGPWASLATYGYFQLLIEKPNNLVKRLRDCDRSAIGKV